MGRGKAMRKMHVVRPAAAWRWNAHAPSYRAGRRDRFHCVVWHLLTARSP